jgi:hypothetical protein
LAAASNHLEEDCLEIHKRLHPNHRNLPACLDFLLSKPHSLHHQEDCLVAWVRPQLLHNPNNQRHLVFLGQSQLLAEAFSVVWGLQRHSRHSNQQAACFQP